jgi:hypothetical protein
LEERAEGSELDALTFEIRVIDRFSWARSQLSPVSFADRDSPAIIAGFVRGEAFDAQEILVGGKKVDDIGSASGADQQPTFSFQIDNDENQADVEAIQMRLLLLP